MSTRPEPSNGDRFVGGPVGYPRRVPMLGVAGAGSDGIAWHVVASSLRTDAFALGADVVLAVVLAGYLIGAAGTIGRRRLGPVAEVSFVCGVAALFVAVGSGLALYQDADPSVAVGQHVLLMMVAPPFLVLGRPAVVWRALRGRLPKATSHPELSPRGGQASRTMVRSIRAGFRRATGVISWPFYYGSMGAYFLTSAYPASLRDPVLLDATQLVFVAVGCLFWSGLVGPDGAGARRSYALRLGAVLSGMPIETAVGLALVLWPHPLVAGETLAATHSSGLLLWLASMFTSGVALAAILVQWCIEDSRRLDAREPLVDAGEIRRDALGGVGANGLTREGVQSSSPVGGGVARSCP